MKKLATCIAATALCLAAAGAAEAKASAKGSFKLYGIYIAPNQSSVIPFGQLVSSKACLGDRKFKVVAVHKGFKPKTVDSGVTSRDGGVSAVIKERDTTGADNAILKVAKSKGCAKVTFSFRDLRRDAGGNGAARLAGSSVQFLSFAAANQNGVFVGSVDSASRKCSANRKITLLLGDKVIDSGGTTTDGSWALHFTEAEWLTPGWIRAVVDKTSKCAGQKTKFNQADLGG